MGFPTKNDHFGVFWGYHHLRKHPFIFGHFLRGPVSNLEFITIGSGLTLVAVDGSRNAENSPVDMIKYPVIWEYFKTSRVVNQISEPSKKYASGMCFFLDFPRRHTPPPVEWYQWLWAVPAGESIGSISSWWFFTNPVEKYARQNEWKSSPSFGVNIKNIWSCHHLDLDDVFFCAVSFREGNPWFWWSFSQKIVLDLRLLKLRMENVAKRYLPNWWWKMVMNPMGSNP